MLARLQQLQINIQHCGLGITIHELRKLCTDHHYMQFVPIIDDIANNYALMRQFFVNGFEDPDRLSLYKGLERRLYNVILELMVDCVAEYNTTFKHSRENARRTTIEYDTIENALLSYDQELTMASLEPDSTSRQKEIHHRLLRYRIALFDAIYTSKPWTTTDAETMTNVLLSPMVDIIDQQIILGAMLLAQRTLFDVNKFRTLCTVAENSTSSSVVERAIVAIALSLPDDNVQQMYGDTITEPFRSLMEHEGMMKKFTELQIQMYACLDTDKIEKTINDDIMPTLVRNSEKAFNHDKTEDELLDSLLHPDKDEKEMADVESAVEKMRKMQENGSDVFFGGFSHVKRFSFFFTLMNWFCPFYFEHPQLPTSNLGELPLGKVERLVSEHNICDSDKYSFVLSLAHIIHQIPQDILHLLKNGEVSAEFAASTFNNPSVERRHYLSDLYRFYALYIDKNNFKSPFASEKSACFFLNRMMVNSFKGTAQALQVCRSLYRKGYDDALNLMLKEYALNDNLEYIKLYALSLERCKHYSEAIVFYEKSLQMAPDNRQLLLRCANVAFMDGLYDDALEYYSRFVSQASTDDDIEVEEFRMALCQLWLGLPQEGMQILYRLAFNSSDESGYYEALAWGNILLKKYEEAVRYYEKTEQPTATALLRKSIVLLVLNRVKEAVNALKAYSDAIKRKTENLDDARLNKKESVFDAVMTQLKNLGLYDDYCTEAMILVDQVLLSE